LAVHVIQQRGEQQHAAYDPRRRYAGQLHRFTSI
jgi:hypothetical protein